MASGWDKHTREAMAKAERMNKPLYPAVPLRYPRTLPWEAMDRALDRAIKDAEANLRDHAKDALETSRFLEGVVDGLRQAKQIAARAHDNWEKGSGR